MSDSEKSMDASKKRFSNIVWAILVILGLAWWFYPQIRILVKPESLSDVSQEAAEETQLPAAVGEVPATVDSVDAKITDAPEMVEAQEVAVASPPTEGRWRQVAQGLLGHAWPRLCAWVVVEAAPGPPPGPPQGPPLGPPLAKTVSC